MRRTNARDATLAQWLTLALTVMLTLVAAAGGCRREAAAVDGVSEATFVATMVELRRLDTATTDSAARQAARTAVLQRRGLTARQLERYAASLADDPTRAQAVFSRIDSTVSHGANGGKPLPPPPSAGPGPAAPSGAPPTPR